MIDQLRDLVRLLSRDVTVADVTARVGAVDRDPGVPAPIALRPSLAGVRAASLARFPDTGLPYVLTLRPADEARPTVGALRGAFGDAQPARVHRGMPAQIVFYPPAEPGGWRVVVIAELVGGAGPADATAAVSVALRRDPPAAP